ncbi:MAG TPA: hypothetical protein VJW20_20415 [Candidatus Angelobacter sp.]|nr:hypothetical protein [Candidatus Angelobacter sp.]
MSNVETNKSLTETKGTPILKAEPPSNAEIDALLQMYDEADRNVDSAIEKRDVFGDQIEQMIKKHGFLPPRSKKSKRIQGDKWKATSSQSHSVDVDGTAVLRLLELMKSLGVARWFRKLFRREEIFILNDGAPEIVNKLAQKFPGSSLALSFAQTLKVESRSSSLKVEPLKEEKAS